ncbi:DUF4261 domain-containing protein [Oxalobacter sp. OttesenSCG-928-P03]|nr:DUF4261 domain-containing protein [Oxalobacter sp. OttesenSCG-928-P03]
MQADWGIELDVRPNDENTLVFDYEDMMVAVSFIPAPIPEAADNAANNVFWEDGVEKVQQHTAHVIVAVMRSEDALTQSLMYSMVASSLLKSANVIGIYQVPTVLPADYFVMVADSIREDVLPVPTWIYFGIYPDGDDFSGYTYGMTYFGMDEIEVIKTKAEPADLYDFLMDVAYYVIDNEVVLGDGDTLGFSEEQKLPLTRSEGVAVDGESIKIGF